MTSLTTWLALSPMAFGLLLVAITPAWAQAKVETAQVVRRDFLESVSVPGTIEGYYQTDIMSCLEGYVGKVHVDIGDRVQRGGDLIELNTPEMHAEVEFDNPANRRTNKRALRSGDYGSATITLSNIPHAIVVPSTAIGNSPTGSYVMQVTAGRALRRRVEVLAQQDGWSAISGPLAVGDVVVANGVDRVKDDQAVITN